MTLDRACLLDLSFGFFGCSYRVFIGGLRYQSRAYTGFWWGLDQVHRIQRRYVTLDRACLLDLSFGFFGCSYRVFIGGLRYQSRAYTGFWWGLDQVHRIQRGYVTLDRACLLDLSFGFFGCSYRVFIGGLTYQSRAYTGFWWGLDQVHRIQRGYVTLDRAFFIGS